jgi:chaperonin GroES
MNYNPNGKRLIVSRKKNEEQSVGGILMPASHQDKKLSEGYVERIGSDCEGQHWDEGMHVIFAQFAGQEIMLDNESYLVLPEEDVLVYGADA